LPDQASQLAKLLKAMEITDPFAFDNSMDDRGRSEEPFMMTKKELLSGRHQQSDVSVLDS